MKSKILITVSAMILSANIAVSQGTDVVLPAWAVNAAADINNTNPATVEQFTDPLDNFKNAKNEFTPYNSVASVGVSSLISKYVSIYNIPMSYSFKTKLLFKDNADAYENFAIKVVLPIAHKMFEVTNLGTTTKIQTTGLGDIALKLNYVLHLPKTFFTFGILTKLPTAKESNLVNGHDVPLGTGSTDIDLSAFCSKEMSSKLTTSAALGYDYRTSMTSAGEKYGYGSRISAMVGGEYFMNNFSAGADLNFLSVANNKMSGIGADYETPGITALDIMPYIRINLPYSMTASINTSVPIVSKYKSVPYTVLDADRKVKVGISITYRFAKSGEEAK